MSSIKSFETKIRSHEVNVHQGISYALNYNLHTNDPPNAIQNKLGEILRQSTVLDIVDSHWQVSGASGCYHATLGFGSTYPISIHPNQTFNAGFLDGHVQSLTGDHYSPTDSKLWGVDYR